MATLHATPATLQSAARALEAFVSVLSTDPRIQRAYKDRLASADRATFDRVICDELGLDYPWLAPVLLQNMTALVVLGQSITVTPEPPAGFPPGRRAKKDAKHIVRDVEWYYRAEIKNPRDSKGALAREYAAISGRSTDSRSVVQNGINRAKALLAIFGDPERRDAI